MARSPGLTISSGRRGFYRFLYGTHYWIPDVQADWSKGIVRDTPRVAIPAGSLYDSTDYLLHQPGVAQKRGGTSYLGPAMTAATYAQSVTAALYASGAQVLAVGDNGHLYTVTAGTTTDVSTLGTAFVSRFPPVVTPSAAAILTVFFANDGTTAPKKWDGAAAGNLGGTPPTALMGAVYKSRLIMANSSANPNRLWFSPVASVETTWDTANSWLDSAQAVSGLAALNNMVLVFHRGTTERLIGAAPPPGTDMDLAPMWRIGCTDARSIIVQDGTCVFANTRGVFISNGGDPENLCTSGGIATYWQSLFAGYDPATWVISCGRTRDFLFVNVLDNTGALVVALTCYLPRRAWWRNTNMRPMMFASTTETMDDLYYADRSTNRVVQLSGIFAPAAGNKNDANGTAVAPTIEFAPFGTGVGIKSYGFGHLDFDMRDAASDNPTMGVTVKTGIEADTSTVPAESPLTETTTLARSRFLLGKDAQSLTVALAQTGPSAKTELYTIEIENRSQPLTGEGVT